MLKWVIAWLLVLPALADEPLSPPADYKSYSPNKRCYAFFDAKNQRTTVLREANPPARLWDMPGWFRAASLSDDCEHLVTGFDGLNLLPLDYKPDLIMLRFFAHGKLIREVKLNELIRDFSRLGRTVSHFSWGHYIGFVERNRYMVETVDGGRVVYDAATGLREAGGKR